MASTYRATATATGNSTSPSVTKPTGTVDGDVVLWVVFSVTSRTVTPPSGFVLVLAQNGIAGKLSIYQHAALSDGASYAGSLSGSSQWICGAVTVQGTSPGVVSGDTTSGSNGTAGSADCIIPAFATTNANSCIVLLQLQDLGFSTTWTADAATTERFDVNDGSSQATLCCDTKDVTTATTYGAFTVHNDTVNIGLNNGRYARVVVADNNAPVIASGMLQGRISRVAVNRASYY